MSNDFKATLTRVQLRSGVMILILYETKQPIAYIGGSYMIHLQKKVEKIEDTKL